MNQNYYVRLYRLNLGGCKHSYNDAKWIITEPQETVDIIHTYENKMTELRNENEVLL